MSGVGRTRPVAQGSLSAHLLSYLPGACRPIRHVQVRPLRIGHGQACGDEAESPRPMTRASRTSPPAPARLWAGVKASYRQTRLSKRS